MRGFFAFLLTVLGLGALAVYAAAFIVHQNDQALVLRFGQPEQVIQDPGLHWKFPFVDTVDLLLDLHSMQHPTAPLMLAGPLDKGVELARRVGVPQVVMRDQGHAAGRRLRDYDGFGDPASPRNALLVECGQHWEAEAAPVAITTALRFLYSTGVVDAQWGADYLAARPLPRTQRVLQVTQAITVRTDRFVFADDYRGLEVIGRAGTRIAHDGDDPVLTPYDDCVLVMPSRRTRPGETAVRLGRYL